MKFFRTGWFVGRWFAGLLRDLVLFSLWMLLAGLFVGQIYVATSSQLTMPDWLLRKFEARIESAGLHAQIASATMDASGHVVINKLQLTPPAFNTPLITVDILFLQLDPWALAAGRFESHDLRAGGVNFWLPAMLSPSGQSEPVISDVALAFEAGRTRLTLDRLSGHMANLTFNIHGTVDLPADLLAGRTADRGDLASLFVRHYLSTCRRLADIEAKLTALDAPHVELTLVPAGAGLANVSVVLTSRGADLDLTPYDPRAGRLQLGDVRTSAEFPLATKRATPVQIDFRCALARSSTGAELHNLRGTFRAALEPDFAALTPSNLALTCDTARIAQFTGDDLFLSLFPGPLPQFKAELLARALDTHWSLHLTADPKRGEGTGRIEGAVTPWIVRLVAAKTGIDADRLLRLSAPAPIAADIILAEGWKLQDARGRLSSGPLVAYGAPLDSAKSAFSYDGHNLLIDDIMLHQGENFSLGSYWMDTVSHRFRFLLNGSLRPMVIAPLFEDWWKNFWMNFDFAGGIPQADVDVAGQWGHPYLTTVFVHADIARPLIRSVPFDRVRATMFIRPEFYDATDFIVDRGTHSARGTFTRSVDLARHDDALRSLDFDVMTNLDLAESARVFGHAGTEVIEPFTFAEPPQLHLSGHVDGPASPRGSHRNIQLDLRSTGAFALFGFPLSDLDFRGTVIDEIIDLEHVKVAFAHGQAGGRIHLSGPDADRRLSFDISVNNASLGETIQTLEDFSAKEKGSPIPQKSRFQQRVAEGRLNLHLAADGLYRNPLSYHGAGNLELTGAQLAEINLLGALSTILSKSSLFSFTSLQLTTARSDFTLDGTKLELPDLKITGPSAIIDAKGTYLLDKKTMEFNAKVYPFSQSKTFFANAVGFVLVPLSNALELKLTGPLDSPEWRFTYGPSNFLHTLADSKYDPTAPPAPPSELQKLPPFFLRR